MEFTVDTEHGSPNGSMRLTMEGWSSLLCHNVSKLQHSAMDTSFSLLPVLEVNTVIPLNSEF